MGIGPKTHIIINPYIKSGLYIVTEDLNGGTNEFRELVNVAGDISDERLIYSVFDPDSPLKIKKSVEEGLNYMSLVTRIFLLRDIKGDNIGFVGSTDHWNELMDEVKSYSKSRDHYVEEEESDNNSGDGMKEGHNNECMERQLKPMIVDFLNHPTNSHDVADVGQYLFDGRMFPSSDFARPYSGLLTPTNKVCEDTLRFIDFGFVSRASAERARSMIKRLSETIPSKILPIRTAMKQLNDRLVQSDTPLGETPVDTIGDEPQSDPVSLIDSCSSSLSKLMERVIGELSVVLEGRAVDNRTNIDLLGLNDETRTINYVPPTFDEKKGTSTFLEQSNLQLLEYYKTVARNYEDLARFIDAGWERYVEGLRQRVSLKIKETRRMAKAKGLLPKDRTEKRRGSDIE
eukprot:gnl/Chilomastix_caulleri/153.p1 GENE.gnl/Chilomastix_caulleri/153~~gnl/Chilomastix_caulleri/153.p1  ORF type:complete len:402 (+),score=89.39 gnl/Chilomastix_caulleri/153:286-1491(+)